MKAYGAKIKKFWNDLNDEKFKLPEGGVVLECDNCLEIDDIADTERYELSEENFGWFTYEDSNDVISFAKLFRKWEKSQTHTTMVIEVPLELKDSVRAYLKSQGIKA